MTISVIVAVCLIVCAGWFISTSNGFKKDKIQIEEAQSGIETALVKRYDILTQSLETVKAYTSHEKEMFSTLAKARRGMSVEETQEVMDGQDKAVKELFALAENYPQLQSNTLYCGLQRQIAETNEHLAASRRLYNSNVSLYNKDIAVFPASIVASMSGMRPAQFYHDDSILQKSEVKLNF